MTDSSWPGLTEGELDALGAVGLPMLRSQRYRGTGQECRLDHLGSRDRETIRLLYDHLRGIYETWRADPTAPDWEAVARRTLALVDSALLSRVGALGRESADEELQRVVHDLRGGAATAVLAEAELLEPGLRRALDAGEVEGEALEPVVLLARDQAKIMRNALVDLDPEERARDTVEKPHAIDDLIGRWRDVRYHTLDGHIRVRATRDAPGILSSCCLEFGAVDRIAYNLINNAARHSADGEVALQARLLAGSDFRIAVTNRVTEDHGGWLAAGLAEDPTFLFRWGATRSGGGVRLAPGGGSPEGTGLGLGIVAEFVAAAFGVPTVREALTGGYLGSTRMDDRLAVWFHWPAFLMPGEQGLHP